MNHQHSQRGQTILLNIIILFAMMGFAALAIEGGRAYKTRRDVQGIADAAALAAVQELPQSYATAYTVARDFTEQKNGTDTDLVNITFSEGNTQIEVEVRQTNVGGLLSFFDRENVDVTASATARVNHMGAMEGMLPMAFLRGAYTVGTNAEIKTDGSGSNHGVVSPDNNPPHCYISSGANDFRNLIKGETNGGMDACAYEPGDLIQTKPGNNSGPTRQGMDDRIGSNTQTFSDVFEYVPSTGEYLVKDPHSPRLGLVPVVENTDGTSAAWPSGTKNMRVLSYVMVYIGKTSVAGNPAHTNNGKSVWVTPVAAVLPEDWTNGQLQDYDENAVGQPVVYRLTQ